MRSVFRVPLRLPGLGRGTGRGYGDGRRVACRCAPRGTGEDDGSGRRPGLRWDDADRRAGAGSQIFGESPDVVFRRNGIHVRPKWITSGGSSMTSPLRFPAAHRPDHRHLHGTDAAAGTADPRADEPLPPSETLHAAPAPSPRPTGVHGRRRAPRWPWGNQPALAHGPEERDDVRGRSSGGEMRWKTRWGQYVRGPGGCRSLG